MPGSREGAGFRFAVTDDSRDNQVRIVVRGAARMGQHIAQFPALVDRARRFGSAVAADAPGKRKLLKELPQTFEVFALVGIHLGVGSFEVTRSKNAGSTMSRPSKKNHIKIVFLDQPVQVNVDKRQTRTRSPVPEQPVLDVLGP